MTDWKTLVSHQTVTGSYPRRTYSLGNTTKRTLFWFAQPFLNTWSGKWANLLYHWSKRCDKRLFSSIIMIMWLIINVANVETRKPGQKQDSSLTYRNIPQNALSLLDCFLKGALDKYNIYLSIEDFRTKPIPKFSVDPANAFSFYEVFCEQHHLQSVP